MRLGGADGIRTRISWVRTGRFTVKLQPPAQDAKRTYRKTLRKGRVSDSPRKTVV